MSEIPGIWFPQIYEQVRKSKPIKDVKKLTGLSQEEFKSYSQKSEPFILKGSLDLLPQNELIATLAKDWKELEIEMRSTNLKVPTAYINRTLTKVKLGDYLANYWGNAGSGYYAGNNPVSDELANQIRLNFPQFYNRRFFNEPRMWLGPKGSVTPLHKDIPDNFAVNYFGVKKWIIFSPADYPFLSMTNPTPEAYPDLGVSMIDVGNPDLIKFPNYSKATPIEFILEAGEMLYLPAGWGHYVENVEDSLLFNFWLLRDKSPAILGRDA